MIRQDKHNKKTILIISLLLIILVAGGYWLYQKQKDPKDLSTSTSIGQNTKGQPSNNTDNESTPKADADSQENTPSDPKKDGENVNTQDKNLKSPAGNFVSSHVVEMNSLIASSCVSEPGAKCTIIFTKSGVTKSLPVQNADLEGATYWEWTPKKIGLTTGDWTIEAKASNSVTSKTTKDAINLVVK